MEEPRATLTLGGQASGQPRHNAGRVLFEHLRPGHHPYHHARCVYEYPAAYYFVKVMFSTNSLTLKLDRGIGLPSIVTFLKVKLVIVASL